MTVADTSSTSVDLGNYTWAVSSLTFGSSNVAGGTYTASALNALGSNPVFSGSGIVRVMPEGSTFQSITHNVAGTTQWVCPPGVTSIQVECWGGGGAGGSSSSTGAAKVYVAGGGGAGGAYARKSIVPVTPGNTYSVTIAPAAVALNPASASTGARVNGADTSFTGDSGVTVLAKGGQGGQCVINPTETQGGIGGAGTASGSISDGPGYVYGGGDGYFPPTKGGSGGGGAGNAEDGGDGYLADPDDEDSASLPGAGGYSGGGEGGLGAAAVGDGGNGFSPGGGGGGARTGRFTTSSGADLQKTGGSGGLGQIVISYLVLPVSLTNREDWRMLHFGTTDPNTLPSAADDFDANFDGESNLLEFATGQDPHARTLASTPMEMSGNTIEFRYSRSTAALEDGMEFQVMWSDSLLEDSWSIDDVDDGPDLANPGSSEVENRVVRIPAGSSGRRFVRLEVSQP
jgi:hyaluronate lyase